MQPWAKINLTIILKKFICVSVKCIQSVNGKSIHPAEKWQWIFELLWSMLVQGHNINLWDGEKIIFLV